MTGLSKQSRLLTKTDYNVVFSKSVKVSNSLFLILIHKTTNSYSRLGLAISKKADKTAVQRNRIKRLCRETFRKIALKKHADFVVLARPITSSKTNKEITASLKQLWQQTQVKIQ